MKRDDVVLAALDTHLGEWRELAQRFQNQMAPIVDIQESLQRSLQPIINAREALQKALEPVVAERGRWQQALESFQFPPVRLPDLSHAMGQVFDFQKTLQDSIGLVFQSLHEAFAKLPGSPKKRSSY